MKAFILFIGFAGYSLNVVVQQTIFSVPSSDVTPKHTILAQQQVDFSREELQATTTVDYGLGRNWEVGFNLYKCWESVVSGRRFNNRPAYGF